jgi:hypothetical protein
VLTTQPTGLGVGVGVPVLVGELEGVAAPVALEVAPGEREAVGETDGEGGVH